MRQFKIEKILTGISDSKPIVEDIEICIASNTQLEYFVQNNIQDITHVLNYLKDK
jgi:hypothetical protein